MHGQITVCKDFNWHPIERVVCEDKDGIVFIYSEDRFMAHLAGLPYLPAVGSPAKDVFRYKEGIWRDLNPCARLKSSIKTQAIYIGAPVLTIIQLLGSRQVRMLRMRG
jgi:hypothetical protein